MSASCVLFSGGLDSAVLLGLERQSHDTVWPVHVRSGLAWETAERRAIDRLLAAPAFASGVKPLTTLTVDMRDVYPASHWAVRGEAPAFDTPDEDVYIEGRNVVLLSKAAVFMARAGISRVLIGPLFRVGDTDQLEQVDDPREQLVLAQVAVRRDALGDLIADAEHGVERRQCVLEDHRDVLAA